MAEQKRNPNPFIRLAQEARADKEKKFDLDGIKDKADQVGKSAPKMTTSAPRATKVQRKAGRGR